MKTVTLLIMSMVIAETAIAQDGRISDSTVQFHVFGNCAMCKERIEKAAKSKGVHAVIWDPQTKSLTLRFDPSLTTPAKVQHRIANAGHDTKLEKAADDVYGKLPPCCLYRDKHDDGKQDPAGVVMGVIMEEDDKGNVKPLKGASVTLSGASTGVATQESGFFSLTLAQEAGVITVSYVGFQPRNIDVKPGDHFNIVLNTSKPMEGIKVVSTRKAAYVSPLSTLRTQVMTERELFKAACCNLSESFETNPSVDVSFSDAVTGARQIQLLGLSGNYTQLTLENLPGPRGIATPWGLNSIPGTWVESIQLTKGVGSVANGFESVAGQINVELKKPATAEQLYANAYVNNMGKTDLNLNLAKKLNKKWSTALLLHDAFLNNREVDFNNDGFRDLPTGNLFTVLNRWHFDDQNGWMGQAGVRILLDSKTGGQTAFDPDKDRLGTQHYGLGIETKRYEAFAKVGYVFPAKRYKSFGFQLSSFRHDQDSYFGTTEYNARQDNFYANLIYQSIISNSNHKFRTGLSLVADKYDELYRSTVYKRDETVAGAFFEYTYSAGEKYSLILGLRGDNNSLFGFFFTPRLHMRYEPWKGTVIRLAGGRGQRTANIFAENSAVLVSSRTVNILPSGTGKAYGLDPEVAWNEGLSADQQFRLFGRGGTFSLMYFRTDFNNQVVADIDKSAHELNFNNLAGKSYSNSYQAELTYELVKKLELRLAYRLFDVKTTYHGELLEKPLLAKNRAFTNLGYEIGPWKFDYTVTYNGTKRLPYTADNPAEYRLAERSPSYVLMNAQISRSFGRKKPFELYLGGENLTNYIQERVILGSDQPFGANFDASVVWGPVTGRMLYSGLRWKIK